MPALPLFYEAGNKGFTRIKIKGSPFQSMLNVSLKAFFYLDELYVYIIRQ